MDLAESFQRTLRNPKKVPRYLLHNSKNSTLNLYRNSFIYYNSRYGIGTNVFDRDWDLLIILDTCRVDALRYVASEYEFLDSVQSHQSVGGQSAEWIARTFDTSYQDAIRDTAYITANPHAKTVLSNRLEENWKSDKDSHINRLRRYGRWNFVNTSEIGKYEPLWEYSNETYQYPPRYVTDRGISIARNFDYDRMILHYMPPHTPYREEFIPTESELNSFPNGPFGYLKTGGNRDTVYETYINMLRWVLDEVEILLENVENERVIITSDHGEAFGEYGVYFHHAGSLHPHIRNVPWTVTTATDTDSYTPSFSLESKESENHRNVEDSLEALGYL